MPQTLLSKIRTFYYKHGRMPSYSEVAVLAKYKSKNAAYKAMQKFIDMGLVHKDTAGKIVPTPLFTAVPLLGTVAAGFPSPAEEELLDGISLEEFLITNKEATYMLTISGDSMIDAGIMPGDIVLVERGKEPKDGDIVIAEIDHQWTVKYFCKKGRAVHLAPGNKKYKNIYPTEELHIAATVTSVIRKY